MPICGWTLPRSLFQMRKISTSNLQSTMNCLTNSKLRTRLSTPLLISSWCKHLLANNLPRKVGMTGKRTVFYQVKRRSQSHLRKTLSLLLLQIPPPSPTKSYRDFTQGSCQLNRQVKTLKLTSHLQSTLKVSRWKCSLTSSKRILFGWNLSSTPLLATNSLLEPWCVRLKSCLDRNTLVSKSTTSWNNTQQTSCPRQHTGWTSSPSMISK